MKNIAYTSITTLLVAFAATVSTVRGDIILAQWDFSSDLNPTTAASGITASAVSYGAFSGEASGGSSYTRSSGGQDLFARVFHSTSGNRILGTSEAEAFDDRNTYFEFTVTPGQATDFTTMTANITAQVVSSGSAANSFTAHNFLRSDADGYTSNLGTGSIFTSSTAAGSGSIGGPIEFSADLSSFQNIDSAVTFRLYTYVTSAAELTSNHVIRVDDITVNAIPEPSSVALMLLGLISAAGFFRRARR